MLLTWVVCLSFVCGQDGVHCIDLGIVADAKDIIRERMISACDSCDVVITSGGVSMGNKDFVKPLLQELGKVILLVLKV